MCSWAAITATSAYASIANRVQRRQGDPVADLMLVEPGEAFDSLEGLLEGRAAPGHANQLAHRDPGRGCGSVPGARPMQVGR